MSRVWSALLVAAAAVLNAQTQQPAPLTLEEAERAALRAHPAIHAIGYEAQAMAETPTQARAPFYPTVSVSLSGAASLKDSRLTAGALNNPLVLDRVAGGVIANQLVYDFGRTNHLVEQAKARAQGKGLEADAVKARILLDVDQQYLNALRAQSILRVARETVKARQLVSDQITELSKAKMKSDLDVSFAGVNLADAKLLLTAAQNEYQAARARLAAAMGEQSAGDWQLVEVTLPYDAVGDLNAMVDEAVRKRPELAVLRSLQRATEEFAKAEKALSYPTVSAIGAAGYTPVREDPLRSRYLAAGINVNLPVFNGKLFQARRREADYLAQAASQRVKDYENNLVRNVRVAHLNARTAFERLALTAQLLNQARLSMQLAQARYDLGLSSIVELSQAQLNQTSAEIAGTSAQYEYQVQRALLRFEIGALL